MPLAFSIQNSPLVENGGVYGDECARDGSLLLQLVRLPRRLGQDAALSDEDHVLTGELLLQLADEPEKGHSYLS